MKILVFGSTGQVARELVRRDQTVGRVMALGRAEADLTDPGACAAAIHAHAPDVVINAAAYTAVDRAEQEPGIARLVNGDAPGTMAQACAARHVPFLHVSTDYVFNGNGTAPWRPQDTIQPQNVYGRTKAAGEEAVRAAGGAHLILRTSWVFSAHGSNFVKTMVRLSQTRDHLNVVADQIGGPTPAAAIADALLRAAGAMAAGQAGGTFHFAGAPDVSWAGFARETLALAGSHTRVGDIATADYPTAAARPLNSRLDCTSLTAAFGITPPDWKMALVDVMRELGYGRA